MIINRLRVGMKLSPFNLLRERERERILYVFFVAQYQAGPHQLFIYSNLFICIVWLAVQSALFVVSCIDSRAAFHSVLAAFRNGSFSTGKVFSSQFACSFLDDLSKPVLVLGDNRRSFRTFSDLPWKRLPRKLNKHTEKIKWWFY